MEKLTLQISILTIIFSFPVFAQDLNIAADGQMYISPTAFVHASSNIVISPDPDTTGPILAGSLIMDSVSDDYSDLFVVGTSTGNAEYRHFTASSATRDLVSPPVSGQTFASFVSANPGKIAAGTINTAPTSLMYGPLNTATSAYEEYLDTDTTPLVAAKGYRAGTVNAETLAYEGVVSTGDVSIPIVYSGAAVYKDNNVIGNPYTTHVSTQDVVSALGAATAVINPSFAVIYGYKGITSNDPVNWIVLGSTNHATVPLITPGQAFIVRAIAVGNFSFPTSARRVSTAAQDNFLPGIVQGTTPSTLTLTLTKGSQFWKTYLYFGSDAHTSRGLDPTWDAGSLGSDFGTHLVEEDHPTSVGVNFHTQALSSGDLTATDYAIPLEVNVAAGQKATISIDDLDVPSGTKFYLDDAELNVQTLLTSNDYTFTPSSTLSGIGRFYLRTTSDTFSSPYMALNSVEIFSSATTKKLIVQGQLRNDSTLILYDIRGRVIQKHQLEASQTRHEIDVSNVSSGVYVANLNNNHQSKTTKLVIK